MFSETLVLGLAIFDYSPPSLIKLKKIISGQALKLGRRLLGRKI